MKFVVLLKELVLFSTIFFLSIVEITNVKLDKNDQAKEKLVIPVAPKRSAYESNVLKNIDFVSMTKDKKFSIAKRDIKAEETLTEIPLSNIIYIENPLVKDFCRGLNIEEFEAENLYVNQLECLTLFNLDQMNNPHPNFKHYFDSNQIKFQNFFLFWEKKDLMLIKNSLLENTLKDMKMTLQDYSNLLKKSPTYKKPFTLEDLKKAFVYMNSQNFKITIQHQTYHALLPFLDIYEIYPKTNVDWSSSLQSFNDTLKLFALENLKKGDPIITNYGEMDNANLLINFGFTIGNNTFPIESEFFLFNWEDQEYPIVIKQNSAKDIIDTVRRIKAENVLKSKVKRNSGFNADASEDLRIFQEMLKQLAQSSNKKRLESLAANLIESPNAANIFRALQAEDILIDENMQNIAEIIKMLNGKTEIDFKLMQRTIYKENKDYFDSVLGVNGKRFKGKTGNKNALNDQPQQIVFEYNNRL